MDIIICATQRCGSTLFIEDMRNTSVLGKPEELFIGWDPEKHGVKWNNRLDDLTRTAETDNGVSAVKIMANQLDSVDKCLSSFTKTERVEPFASFAKAFKDSLFVWLKREDIVAQAISRVMSRQTGINHATKLNSDEHFAGNLLKGYNADYNANTKYNYAECLREVTSIALENLVWYQFFKDFEVKPLQYTYENLIIDESMSYLDEVAERVGVTGKIEKSPRKLVKLGNSRNEEWHNRFMRDATENKFRQVAPAKLNLKKG